MHCIHESVYVLPAAFAAALCRKIVFCQWCPTRPGAAGTNRCTFYINLLLLKANKAEGIKKKKKKEKKINMIQLKMCLLLWGNCMMKLSINPRVYATASGSVAATNPLSEYLFPSRSWMLHRSQETIAGCCEMLLSKCRTHQAGPNNRIWAARTTAKVDAPDSAKQSWVFFKNGNNYYIRKAGELQKSNIRQMWQALGAGHPDIPHCPNL